MLLWITGPADSSWTCFLEKRKTRFCLLGGCGFFFFGRMVEFKLIDGLQN